MTYHESALLWASRTGQFLGFATLRSCLDTPFLWFDGLTAAGDVIGCSCTLFFVRRVTFSVPEVSVII